MLDEYIVLRMKVSKRKDEVSKTVFRSLFCMSGEITT